MRIDRRVFLGSSAAAAVGVSACSPAAPEPTPAAAPAAAGGTPASITALKPMTDGIKPITADERAARIEKARKLMADNKLDAIFLEGGSSMFYFTGVRWGLSERPFVCVIPAKGELGWVCPGFEEERARELVSGQSGSARVGGGRKPLPADGRHPEGSRRRQRPRRRRRAPALLHLQRREEGSAGHRLRRRGSDHRRLPHVQVAGRDGADAAGHGHHHRRLPGRVRDLPRRDDAGRPARPTSPRRIARSARPAAARR